MNTVLGRFHFETYIHSETDTKIVCRKSSIQLRYLLTMETTSFSKKGAGGIGEKKKRMLMRERERERGRKRQQRDGEKEKEKWRESVERVIARERG